jgi:hypothetical protein
MILDELRVQAERGLRSDNRPGIATLTQLEKASIVGECATFRSSVTVFRRM